MFLDDGNMYFISERIGIGHRSTTYEILVLLLCYKKYISIHFRIYFIYLYIYK